jgi:putative protease
MDNLPELLAPAGSLEKLRTAVLYGADAVYIGGQKFGMRQSADNFSEDEIELAVDFASRYGVKVYVTLNAFLHSDDFRELDEYCTFLDQCGVSAVIVSDAGVVDRVKQVSGLPVHLSTQASCVNADAGLVWKSLGVERLILGRECSIAEAREIGDVTNLEIELFAHGSMCMAFSGHCTISNFTAGRDSNRGGCIQSCRFNYAQESEDGSVVESHFMSSRDLNGLSLVPDFVSNGISSLKIEGRMKSLLYLATTVKAYRMALDAFAKGKFQAELKEIETELLAIPHREYTQAWLAGGDDARYDSVFDGSQNTMALATRHFLGTVLEVNSKEMLVKLNRPVHRGMVLEVLPFEGKPVSLELEMLRDVLGRPIEQSRQDTVVWINGLQPYVEPNAVLRCM